MATRPIRLCISLMVFGDSIFNFAWILLGLASIPLYETMNPMTFPDELPKAHLLGINFLLYRLSAIFSNIEASP